MRQIGSLVPPKRRASAAVFEIIPEGVFLTYGIGVPLRKMLDPAAARARVPVTPEAPSRSRVARTYLNLAEIASATGVSEARNAAAGNAVLAAIAASDALCCRRLGRRSREQDHNVAATMLAKITPDGTKLARDLAIVLAVKNTAHYGTTFLTEAKLKAALRSATRLVEAAESA